MGTRKSFAGLLSLVITVLICAGCGHTEPDIPSSPFLWLDGSTVQSANLDGEAQKIYFHLYDASDYKASIVEGESWVDISRQSAGGIELTLSENVESRREARIILKSDAGQLSIELSQSLSQRGILMKFFESTGGSNWKEKDGWCTDRPLDEWFGVTLGPSGKVIWLILDGNHLEGTIPEEFYELKSLRFLSLKNRKALNTMDNSDKDNWNKLSGGISHSIAKLESLETLYLAGNPLGGDIPDELWSDHIKEIYLDRCSLTGGLSHIVKEASSMTSLSLNDNNIRGAIPSELCSLPKLEGIMMGNVWKNSNDFNQFDSIPEMIGDLHSLKCLSLPDCGLSGTIPQSLFSLPFLENVYLYDNSLSGIIEADWIKMMKNIDRFEIYNNIDLKIRGEVPSCVDCNPAQIIE